MRRVMPGQSGIAVVRRAHLCNAEGAAMRAVATSLFALMALTACDDARMIKHAYRIERWGSARVMIAGAKDAVDGPVLVYVHGFASKPEHQLRLAAALEVPIGTRFVFPIGPLRLEEGRRAWWML